MVSFLSLISQRPIQFVSPQRGGSGESWVVQIEHNRRIVKHLNCRALILCYFCVFCFLKNKQSCSVRWWLIHRRGICENCTCKTSACEKGTRKHSTWSNGENGSFECCSCTIFYISYSQIYEDPVILFIICTNVRRSIHFIHYIHTYSNYKHQFSASTWTHMKLSHLIHYFNLAVI